MGFGPWDLFKLMFASGNVARHVGRSNWSSFDARYEQRKHEELVQNYIDRHKDPELEAKYSAMIDDPDMYDEVWTMLEKDRAHAVDLCMNRRPRLIEGSWEPEDLHTTFGDLDFVDNGRCSLDNEKIKKRVLYALMNRRGKCPMFCIKEKAEFFLTTRGTFVPRF